MAAVPARRRPARPAIPPNMLDMPIEELDLPMRAYNSLKRNNIVKVGQLLQLQDEDLLRMRNFGKKSLDEMKERLRMRGFLARRRRPTASTTSRTTRRSTTRTRAEPCLAHRIDGRKLSRKKGPRLALYKNLIVAVLRYEQIKTTEARAKEVRGQVEKMITLAKEGDLAARRRIVVAAAGRAARHRQADQRDRTQVRRPHVRLHPDRQARPTRRRCAPNRPARARLMAEHRAGEPTRPRGRARALPRTGRIRRH